ncbi:MAG TPA: hypothetical protein DCP92_12485 [Nitrospiraceae bacterium]|nr:hypothetical protein [Nitrospiraceae bacterium]
MYSIDHPLTKESIGKSFRFLQKLFESEGNITLGVAKDALMMHETILDKKNLALKEFALSLHSKGIAAITLHTTLTIEELLSFHMMISEKDTPMGPALLEVAEQRGLRDIKLFPLDLSKFKFVEGSTRRDGLENTFWEDYVSGLLEGRLEGEDMGNVIENVSPEAIAGVINKSTPGESAGKSYDTVIASYLGGMGPEDQKAALFGKFLTMIDHLTPELKQQFLTKSFTAPSMDADEVVRLLRELPVDDIDRMMKVFNEQSSLLPEKLKNLVDKLKSSSTDVFGEIRGGGIQHLDDISVDDKIVKSFQEVRDNTYAEKRYHEDLKKMAESPRVRNDKMTHELEAACSGEIVDMAVSKIMLELLNVQSSSREEYQKLLSRLTDFASGFIETGRFSEICDIYNTLYTHAQTGAFREETSQKIKSFFGSEVFLVRLIDAFQMWGRHNKEGVINISRVLRSYVITPLLDKLSEENNTFVRRFFLDVLSKMGDEVALEAVRRLDDPRWFVTRNMIYLLRECEGSKFIGRIRPFAKHHHEKVILEAVKTLLHFRTPDSISYLRLYLQSDDPSLREQTIRLAGTHKVKEAVPYLIELLEKKPAFGAELSYKGSVVKALGEIGEPGALKILHKICASTSLLHRSELEKLKIEIFETLHRYPVQDVKPLLESGLKSRITTIKSISERLLNSSGENRD